MKKFALLALAAICLPSCWIAQISTEVPTTEVVVPVKTVYTTQVTTPSPKVTTVSTFVVTDYNTDPCFYLDLNAVAAAYAESRSVREFEQIINSSRYMINNLDLNHDGWIDYLRVIETYKGYYHAMLIQACLAPGIFQDVATLVAERRSDVLYVEVIGDRYLYGANYIVRPVFIKRPPMWDVYGNAHYTAWSSPYYYGNFPSYYTKPKPVYLNHYQAYVRTYMSNHHYCHHCDYPPQPYNNNYTSMTQPHRRNDFAVQHPDNSFERRVTRTANGNRSVASATNATQLRTAVNEENAARERTQTSQSPTQSSTRTATSTTSTTRAASTTDTNKTTSTSTRTSTSATTTTTRTANTNKATSSTSTTRTSTSSTSSTRTSTSSTTRQPNTTTVESRVNKSGTTRTTVKTTDAAGRTQKAPSSTSTSTRSSRGSTIESTPRSSQRVR